MPQLPSQYSPKGIEDKWYKIWEEGGYFSYKFHPDHAERKKFSMVIPPPNVTGSLHLGHALNHTIQDILTRYNRMLGRSVLWLPGTDHAGIATQNIVERMLAKENKNRHDLGRGNFEKRTWLWKEESGGMISHQQRELGESIDWSMERFTLDEGLNRIVKQVFIRLYSEGLIYRAERMINWCPVNQTALSNIEVDYKTIQGKLYYIDYPVAEAQKGESIQIATTRPETMLGDEAIAVHPDDTRYKPFIGKNILIPLISKEIPVIADDYVDPEFGTGAVKITPAHDPNDFEVGKRHELPLTIVMDEKGRINENGYQYKGLSREEARKKIVNGLEEEGFLSRVEDYKHQVGHSYRSGAVVEPLPSTQWFVACKDMAGKAIEVVKDGNIEFIPKRWENVYFDWMYNIQDWCISRQLWWGHRIPAYYDQDGNIYVAESEEEARRQNGLSKDVPLCQDEDVLDTWFSSGLWPFATLWGEKEILEAEAWPSPSQLQKDFYPNDVLVTSFDIIFFWVARMIMLGTHFMKDVPFSKVYIHGLVRDAHRQKMSKSKGNVVNPLEKMQAYGTDAFRFFLMSILPEGKDIIYDETRMKGYQAFCNKVWNTGRYLWLNQDDEYSLENASPETLKYSEVDYWILAHFNQVLKKINQALEKYHFAEYAQLIYDFTWKHYCDYYIELAKISLQDAAQKEATLFVLNFIFQAILKLLHPIMPFLTEELYSYWRKNNPKDLLIISNWPEEFPQENEEAFRQVESILSLIYVIRNIRGELSLPPSLKIDIAVVCKNRFQEEVNIFEKYEKHICALSRLSRIQICTQDKKETSAFGESSSAKHLKTNFEYGELYLDILDKIDLEQERQRVHKKSQKLEKELNGLSQRLNNPSFVQKAPEEIVTAEKERQRLLKNQLEETQRLINSLGER